MQKQTLKNKAPVWPLTVISIQKGKELSKKYKVDEKLVLTSLYLAHTIFDTTVKGKIQKNHTQLSSQFVRSYLKQWNVSKEEQNIIINAIKAHHGEVPTKSKVAEIMKNAECFKFVTLKGCLIYFKDLKKRGYLYDEAIKQVLHKMETKKQLLTLKECKKDAEKNCREIKKVFNDMKKSKF